MRKSSARLIFFRKYLDNQDNFKWFYSKLILQWRNFFPGTTKSTRLYNINFSGAKFLYTKLKRAIWAKPFPASLAKEPFKKSPVVVTDHFCLNIFGRILQYETAVPIELILLKQKDATFSRQSCLVFYFSHCTAGWLWEASHIAANKGFI